MPPRPSSRTSRYFPSTLPTWRLSVAAMTGSEGPDEATACTRDDDTGVRRALEPGEGGGTGAGAGAVS